MQDLLYSLRYVLPSVVVFLTAYYLLREFFQNQSRQRKFDLMGEKIRISLPLRLQAYERIILLLERISPNSLVMRVYQPGLSVKEFHQLLIKSIRDEFSHNLSQQLYVSIQAWEMIKNAKEEMIRQINTSAARLDEKATATDLSNKLLEMSVEKLATRRALDFLKEEARKNF